MNGLEALDKVMYGQSSYEKRIPMIELFQIISKDLEKLQAIKSLPISEAEEALNYIDKALCRIDEIYDIDHWWQNKYGEGCIQEYHNLKNALKKSKLLESKVREYIKLQLKSCHNPLGMAETDYIHAEILQQEIQALLGDE